MGLQPFDRDLTAARTAYGASRPVPVRPGEGPFTEPRADAQPWRPELGLYAPKETLRARWGNGSGGWIADLRRPRGERLGRAIPDFSGLAAEPESSTPKPPVAVRGDIAAHGRIGLASAMNQSLSAEAPAARHACDTVHLRGKFGCAGAAVNGKTISWRARNETRTPYCLETMECARRFTQLDGVAVGSSLP